MKAAQIKKYAKEIAANSNMTSTSGRYCFHVFIDTYVFKLNLSAKIHKIHDISQLFA